MDGVKEYTKMTASFQIAFPKGKENCRLCQLLIGDRELHRAQCFVTKEIIENPDVGRGAQCILNTQNM